MSPLKIIAIIILSSGFFSPSRVFSQTEITNMIDIIAIPFSIPPKNDMDDFGKFQANLVGKKIFALGEASHGTKEFFTVKDRLIRFLITKMNVKSIVIETDFSGTLKVNDFILFGLGDPREALLSVKMSLYDNQEFLDMVMWLRNYNSKQSQENKVHFYGCDMQTPASITNALLNGSIKTRQALSKSSRDGLRFLFLTMKKDLKHDEIILLQKTADELKTLEIVDNNQSEIQEQAIGTIIQAINLRLNIRNLAGLRDEYLAENCQWLYDYHKKSNMVIWAHNLHVNKTNSIFKHKPMGQYLKEKHRDTYYALGFGFGSGTVRAIDFSDKKSKIFDIKKVTEKNSSDLIFSQSRFPNFILDFKVAAENTELNRFLNKKIYSRAIGWAISLKKQSEDVFMPLVSLYDGILFIRDTTAASEQLSNIN